MRRYLALALVVTCLVATERARASDDVARAEQLFQEARALVAEKRYEEACPKLAESLALDPAVGTQFNLADCHEHVGRTATAHRLFLEVARIARAAGKFERERSARERAESLAPSLSRLVIRIEQAAPGLEVRLDGEVVKLGGEPLLVDPGDHEVNASAPGRRPFVATFLAERASVRELVVPGLAPLESPALPRRTAPIEASASNPRRTLAALLAGVGAVGIATGAVAGVLALTSRSEADQLCPRGLGAIRCTTQEGVDRWNDAATAGDVSTVAFVAGGVALIGAGAVWWLGPRQVTSVAVSPSGLRLSGRF